MIYQKQTLHKSLLKHGWVVVEKIENPEWWAEEVWSLESVWTPVGAGANLTFLVDPQEDSNVRTEDMTVWAVGVSRTKPNNRLSREIEFTLSLGTGWETELTALFDSLNTIRIRT